MPSLRFGTLIADRIGARGDVDQRFIAEQTFDLGTGSRFEMFGGDARDDALAK